MTTSNGNLYKFMAFFGLLLFISCVLLPYLKLDDNNKEIYEIRRTLVVLNHEREALVNDIKAIEDSKDLSTADSVASAMRSKALRISEVKKGIDLRTEQISLEEQILEERLAKQNDIKYFMGYFIIISFLITICGFLLWFFKIQRPVNRSIKLEFLKHISKE